MGSKMKRNIDTTAETEAAPSEASEKKKFKEAVTTTTHDTNTKRSGKSKKLGNGCTKDDVAASKTVPIKDDYGVNKNVSDEELMRLSLAAKRAAAEYAAAKLACGKSAAYEEPSGSSARAYVKQPWKQRDLQTNWKYSNKFNPRHEKTAKPNRRNNNKVDRWTANTWGRPDKWNTQYKNGPVQYHPRKGYVNPESVATYLQCWKNDVRNWTHMPDFHTWLSFNLLCADKVSNKSFEIAMEYFKADGDFSTSCRQLDATTRNVANQLGKRDQFTTTASDRFKRIKKLCKETRVHSGAIPATNYLMTWKNDRLNWKYDIIHNNWLCTNISYPTKIADEYFDIALEFFACPECSCEHLANKTQELAEELKKTGELTQDQSDRVERIMKVCEGARKLRFAEAEKYLHTWKNDRPSWKYNISLDNWLSGHLVDKKIADEYFNIAMEYFGDRSENRCKVLANKTYKLKETGQLTQDQSDRVETIIKLCGDAEEKLASSRFAEYLHTWKDDSSSWKFNEKLHDWLCYNLLDDKEIGAECFDIAMEYFDFVPLHLFKDLVPTTKKRAEELTKTDQFTTIVSDRFKRIMKQFEKTHIKSGAITAKSTTNYLKTWKKYRHNWKFSEKRHFWLCNDIIYPAKIADEYFDIALEYFGSLKRTCGGLVHKTQQLAEKLKKKGELSQDQSDRVERIMMVCTGGMKQILCAEAEKYLHTWKNDRPSWKFSKMLHNWLSGHLLDKMIADEYFNIAVEYFGSPERTCNMLPIKTQKLAARLKNKNQLNKDRYDRIMELCNTKLVLTVSEQGNADNKKVNPEEPQDDDVEKSDKEIEKSDEEIEESEGGMDESDKEMEGSDGETERSDKEIEKSGEESEGEMDESDKEIEKSDEDNEGSDEETERSDEEMEKSDDEVEETEGGTEESEGGDAIEEDE